MHRHPVVSKKIHKERTRKPFKNDTINNEPNPNPNPRTCQKEQGSDPSVVVCLLQ